MSSSTPSHGPTPVADNLYTPALTSLSPSDPLDMPITITFLRSREASVGQRHPTTARRLFNGWANHPIEGVTNKLALPGFSLAVFDANHRRSDKVQLVYGAGCVAHRFVDCASTHPPDGHDRRGGHAGRKGAHDSARRIYDCADASVGGVNEKTAMFDGPQTREREVQRGDARRSEPGMARDVDQEVRVASHDRTWECFR